MSSFETPSSALQASVKKYPDRAALKIPTRSPEGVVFKDITYTQFQKDVELSARYWRSELSKIGAQDRAVVGVW
jgi:acyl-CoA synthetase (AMP-forming)/AMP-acid ligase II